MQRHRQMQVSRLRTTASITNVGNHIGCLNVLKCWCAEVLKSTTPNVWDKVSEERFQIITYVPNVIDITTMSPYRRPAPACPRLQTWMPVALHLTILIHPKHLPVS